MQAEAQVALAAVDFQVAEVSPAVIPVEEIKEAGRNTGFFQKIL